jgi:hypothetical protein
MELAAGRPGKASGDSSRPYRKAHRVGRDLRARRDLSVGRRVPAGQVAARASGGGPRASSLKNIAEPVRAYLLRQGAPATQKMLQAATGTRGVLGRWPALTSPFMASTKGPGATCGRPTVPERGRRRASATGPAAVLQACLPRLSIKPELVPSDRALTIVRTTPRTLDNTLHSDHCCRRARSMAAL